VTEVGQSFDQEMDLGRKAPPSCRVRGGGGEVSKKKELGVEEEGRRKGETGTGSSERKTGLEHCTLGGRRSSH